MSVIIPVSMALNSVAQLINGHLQRKQHEKDTIRADERYVQDRADRHADRDRRDAHFVWEKDQALEASVRRNMERTEDFARLKIRDIESRSHDVLRRVFNGTSDGTFLNEPYTHPHPNMKSLRVLLQMSGEKSGIHRQIENSINSAIKEYDRVGGGNRIHLPTGAWIPGAHTGSWVAAELHQLNPTMPGLILRLDPSADGNNFLIHADMFGFPIGDQGFEQNIIFGQVSKNPAEIAQVLSLITLSVSDMYYLSNYGNMPQLPGVLPNLMEHSNDMAAALFFRFQDTVNTLAHDNPSIGVPAALRLADSMLVTFADQTLALQQVKYIEDLTKDVLSENPELVQRLQDVYTRMSLPEEAERLAQFVIEQAQIAPPKPILSIEDKRTLWENNI